MVKRFIVFGLGLMMSVAIFSPVLAQSGNVVANGNMEVGFGARDDVVGVPTAWAFRRISGEVKSDKNVLNIYSRSQPTSWWMGNNYNGFVAAGYQKAPTTPGLTYRMEAFAVIRTCDDNVNWCMTQDGRFSDKSSGMRVRIGIDPFAGDDPTSSNIIWGPWIQPFEQFAGTTVDAVAQTDRASIILYVEAGRSMAVNEAYWDDVSFYPIESLPPQPVNNVVTANQPVTSVVVAPPPSNLVPFVSPQQARPDGSVVHVVSQGDTFDSILVAYLNLGITRESVLALNNLKFTPEFIQLNQEIKILPPGSVDPTTGQLLSLTGGAVPSSAPVATSPEVQTTTSTTTTTASSVRTLTVAEITGLPAVEAVQPFIR